MAEWLRRTLKARVRKSVGSIPTECNFLLGFRTECNHTAKVEKQEKKRGQNSPYRDSNPESPAP